MLSHVTIGSSDLTTAIKFYRGLMAICDWELKFAGAETGWAAWRPKDFDRPLFVVCLPFDGNTALPGNGQMVAFEVASRQAVDLAHQYAMQSGGSNEGSPGLRPHYHPHYYGAYIRDPDGNKICICCQEANA